MIPEGTSLPSRRGWFDPPGRADRLRRAATRWLGTPWAANSAAPGRDGGVSCHLLPRALYLEVGALAADFPWVTGDPNATRHGAPSLMVPWLAARPEFSLLDVSLGWVAGDLLGLRLYRGVDHLAVALGGPYFLHVLRHQRTTVDTRVDPTWSARLLAAWRIRDIATIDDVDGSPATSFMTCHPTPIIS